MAIRLTCAACQSDVEAQIADRGKSVKCGTCWANVIVPAADPSATAPPIKVAVAKPITPVVAKAIPLSPTVPASSTSTPVVAVVAKAIPVTATPAKAPDSKPVKPRFKSRDDKDRDDEDDDSSKSGKRKPKRDWDDDDDDKKKKEKSGGGIGVMIAIIAVIVVVVLGLIGGLIFMLMGSGGTPATTPNPTFTPSPNPLNNSRPGFPQGGDFAGGNGGFNPPAFDPPKNPPKMNPQPGENKPFVDPNKPIHPKPITQEWVKQEFKGGASGMTPPRLAKETVVAVLDNNEGALGGFKAVSEDSECIYHFWSFDLLEGKDYDLKTVATQCVKGIHGTSINGIDEGKFDGKDAKKLELRGPFGGLTEGYCVKLGYRVFTFFVLSKETFYKESNATVEERTKKFFDSINITFDPKKSNPYEGEPAWVPMDRTVGFKVNLPRAYKGVTVTAHNAGFFDNVPGKVYKAELDGIVYEVYVHDLALQPKKGYEDVVKAMLDNHKIISGPDDAKLGGLKAEEHLSNAFASSNITQLRTTTVGRKVYSVRVSRGNDWNTKVGDKLFADRAKMFFDSLRFDGVAAPPANANPGENMTKPSTKPDVPAASSETMVILDKKVDPFWCAVVLPNRKELITAGMRGGNTANITGVLTRYSLPDFKQLGTYTYSRPIFRIVASEPGGRLYFASASTNADAKGMPEREIATLMGDVTAVDLKVFTDGTLGDGDKLKIAQTYPVSGAISGIELSTAGDALYVSTVVMSGKRPNIVPKGGKLLKCETISGKWAPEINTDSPIWAMSLSADGQLVGAIERRSEGGGNLMLIDTVAWKRTKSTNVSDTAEDAARGEPGTMVILQASATACKLVSLGGIGQTQVVMHDKPMQYAKVLGDAKQVLLSRGAGENSVVFGDIDWVKGTLKPLATNDTIGGNFLVTPDGQYAIWNNGSVVDLKKIKKY